MLPAMKKTSPHQRWKTPARALRPALAVLGAASLLFVTACEFEPEESAGESSAATSAASDTAETSPTPQEEVAADADASPTPEEKKPEDTDAVRIVRGKLDELAVKGRAPKTGYERSQFGQRWKDIDRNGCDQRNDVLARDMTMVSAPKGCKVLAGQLKEPYTGQVMNFQRGPQTSSEVHIDHVVALSDAWQKGAQQLSPERREAFANDHRNLLAVQGKANIQKGDGDAATWLPKNKGFRCQYVAIQVNVKHAYQLWVTAAEKEAINRVLDGCGPGSINLAGDGTGTGPHAIDGLLRPGAAQLPPPQPAPPAPPKPRPAPAQPAPAPLAPAPVAPAQSGGAVYYKNCAAARAAGAAPIYAGQPGYRPGLDGDKDGVACE